MIAKERITVQNDITCITTLFGPHNHHEDEFQLVNVSLCLFTLIVLLKLEQALVHDDDFEVRFHANCTSAHNVILRDCY